MPSTWFGGDGFWGDANDWGPPGVPGPGDTAVVAAGTLHVSHRSLDGVTLELLGTSEATAPVVILNDVTLGPDLSAIGPPPSNGAFATIDVAGAVTSPGTVQLGGRPGEPGEVTMALGAHARFVNDGTMNVFDGSNLTVSGAGPESTFVNDGVVKVSGAFGVNFDTRIAGTGTFEVGPSTGGDGLDLNGAVARGITVDLSTANVNEMLLLGDPAQFHGAVSGLAGDNVIDLPNTPADAHSFANGVLTLSDNGAVVARLDLLGVSGANLVVTEQNGGTIVSNGYVPPPGGGAVWAAEQAGHQAVAGAGGHH